jgi:hypothetical protein
LLRTAALLVFTTLALAAASASAAPTAARGISPSLVHQGQKTTLTAKVAKNAVCRASLQFSNGRMQMVGPKQAPRGRVTFVVSIPADAAVGQGKWSVNCNIGPASSGTFVVVTAKSTASTATPRVVVSKQGFSQKPDSWGGGSHVSFGLVLHNDSTTDDAANVYLIVNFVSSTGALIGSFSKTLPLVQSGVDFAYGDSMSLRTQESVASLEISVRVGAHQRKTKHVVPDFANVRIVPNQSDATWVSEIDGEIVNDNSPLTLMSVNLSIVVFDASGLPIGGGSGNSGAAQPPNTRFVFLAQQGFDAIPMGRAASVVISAAPTYGPAL